jgi:phosphomannomutase
VDAGQAPAVLRAIRHAYADRKLSFLDGIYVDLEGGWMHVRRSNTEPVMRITVEARGRQEAEALAATLRAQIEAAKAPAVNRAAKRAR